VAHNSPETIENGHEFWHTPAYSPDFPIIDFGRLKPVKEILWPAKKFSADEVKGK
jgi:hypothetical protein